MQTVDLFWSRKIQLLGVSFVCLVEDELKQMDMNAIGSDYGLKAQVQALSPLPPPC